MYFIPIALLVKTWGSPAFWATIQQSPADYPNLTLGNFLANLAPVNFGNPSPQSKVVVEKG